MPTASEEKNPKNVAVMAVSLLIFLVGATAINHFRLLASKVTYDTVGNVIDGVDWEEAPASDMGAKIFNYDMSLWHEWVAVKKINDRHPPVRLVVIHSVANKSVFALNRVESVWWLFASGGIFLTAFLFASWRRKSLRFNSPTPHYIFLFVASVCFAGVLVGFPVSDVHFLAPVKWLLATPAAVAAVIFGAMGAFKKNEAEGKDLKYGPSFAVPVDNTGGPLSKDKGVPIGTYDREILPEYTRWASQNLDDGIVIGFDKISCGITILGDMGCGKSRLMMAFHDSLRKNYPGIPFLIHDPKGEWYRTYFDPKTDVVFAPHFTGSSSWTLWSDLKNKPELQHEIISTAVYAHASGEDTFWMNQAVSLLREAFSQPTLQEARDYIVALKEAKADDKFFQSVLGSAKLGLLDMAKIELASQSVASIAGPKSIDDYLKWPGRIFLLNDNSCATEQKGPFSLFLSMFLLRALSMPDVPAGQLRLAAFIDEALTFNLPKDVERRIYTQCRSKGMCLIAGAQRLPDRFKGEIGSWKTAEFMFGMKVLDPETQSVLSKRVGEIHYEKETRSETKGMDAAKSETVGEQVQRHPAIPQEFFERVKRGTFFLFHSDGVAPGRVIHVGNEQRQDMTMPQYDSRSETIEFAKSLE